MNIFSLVNKALDSSHKYRNKHTQTLLSDNLSRVCCQIQSVHSLFPEIRARVAAAASDDNANVKTHAHHIKAVDKCGLAPDKLFGNESSVKSAGAVLEPDTLTSVLQSSL